MIGLPERVHGITHPLVREMYLKKDLGTGSRKKSVLVIDLKEHTHDEDDQMFDSYLVDLLSDLNDLKDQAIKKIGKFDHIDIRTH